MHDLIAHGEKNVCRSEVLDGSQGHRRRPEWRSGVGQWSADSDDDKPEGFWNKNKKWLKPVAIGVGSLGLLFAGYKIVTHKKPTSTQPALSGVPKSSKKRKKHKHFKSKKHKKESVALL